MASKVGLAAQLAKQAAQAAREEAEAAEGKAKQPVKPGWQVPSLKQDFQLDKAMNRAVRQVTAHYQKVLNPEGLKVGLEQVPAAPAEGAGKKGGDAVVTEAPQAAPELKAILRENGSGKEIQTYTCSDLLTMFATQQQSVGVVVDGQV